MKIYNLIWCIVRWKNILIDMFRLWYCFSYFSIKAEACFFVFIYSTNSSITRFSKKVKNNQLWFIWASSYFSLYPKISLFEIERNGCIPKVDRKILLQIRTYNLVWFHEYFHWDWLRILFIKLNICISLWISTLKCDFVKPLTNNIRLLS